VSPTANSHTVSPHCEPPLPTTPPRVGLRGPPPRRPPLALATATCHPNPRSQCGPPLPAPLPHSLGRVLAQLEAFGAETVARTVVVFHSDHGYQLDELNEWTKMTNTELATHVPLLIRAPWAAASVGQRTSVKAELVDLYRTLAELSGNGSDDVQTCRAHH
jgi:hypothetical protein